MDDKPFNSAASRSGDWTDAPAYVWSPGRMTPIVSIAAPELDLLRGIDQQKTVVVENVRRLAHGHAAHDMLLWGARGMGKSALLRSATIAGQRQLPGSLALVQVNGDDLGGLPDLFRELGQVNRRFLVFIDDIGFEAEDRRTARRLRSVLDGGVDARPENVRLAVTSNRRAIIARTMSEQDDPINPRDAVDDSLALADRFGLSIGFHACSQDDYLAIIEGYARDHGLTWDEREALEWAKRRGARSGRVAWHFITELAGRSGRSLG